MDTQQQKLLNILVLGETCIDLYRFGRCERMSVEAPVPILKQSRVMSKPGMATNVALNIKSLGHGVTVISNTNKIIKERFIDERFSQQILRVDSNDSCDPAEIKAIENHLSQNTFDATVISDYNKGFLPANLLSNLLPILPKPIFVDSKKKDLSCYENCFIKINEQETQKAESIPSSSQLITTLGEKGAMWNGKVFPASQIQDVFDVCGAGDSFLASFAVKLLSCDDVEEAIKFANVCAGISVRHLGVYNVSLEDLKNEML